MSRILSKVGFSRVEVDSQEAVEAYREVLSYADSSADFLDLIASFRENNLSKKVQKEVLKIILL